MSKLMNYSVIIILLSIFFMLNGCSEDRDNKNNECKENEHIENNKCINNIKKVSCKDNSPENSNTVQAEVDIKWENNKWSEATNCEWTCKSNYRKKDNKCVLIEKECEIVNFDNIVLDGFDNGASVYNSVLGNYKLILEFYESSLVGDYDLVSVGINDNYKTCKQCVLVQNNDKYYYPKLGSLKILSGDAFTGKSSGSILDTELVEVTLDENNGYKSTVVEGGSCIKIENSTWDTTDNISCENNETRCNNGKVETCEAHVWKLTNDCSLTGATCDETKKVCVNTSGCIGLSFDTITVNTDLATTYNSVNGDYDISFEFYTNTAMGSYDLSAQNNSNYVNCDQCVLIKNNDKRYFQKSGVIKVISGDAYTPKSKAEVTNLKLVEVTLSDSMESTVVANGECIEVQTVLWDTMN